MNLPQSDFLDIGRFSRIFDNKSESYKLFWFKAIVDQVCAGNTEPSYEELIDNMIAEAWYMVTEYHLNLGPSDTLEKAVKRLAEISNIKSSEKKEKILDYIKNCDDKELKRYKSTLTRNVPYRLQAPFIQVEWSKSVKVLAEQINRHDRLMYYFSQINGMQTHIKMDKGWTAYIERNQEIIKGWIELNMITYLQRRNPSVPGIVDKIHPPQERKLQKVQKYWKLLIEMGQFHEIYGGNLLDVKDLSIDHFVPWSYVAHDEFWNLHPTTRSINSSKSNNLPDWDTYFPLLGDLEYASYKIMWEKEKIHKAFEDCAREHLNNQDVRYRLYREGLEKEQFQQNLREVLTPVYQSAENAGFGKWIYR